MPPPSMPAPSSHSRLPRQRSSRRFRPLVALAVLAAAATLVSTALSAPGGTAAPGTVTRSGLTPARFAEISSGVTLIHTMNCAGRVTGSGSGFLIGDRIVMTARHVIDPPGGRPACRTKVRVKGRWIRVQDWSWWYDRKESDGRLVDLAVLKLSQRVDAHLFRIRPAPVRIGTNIAALGHPLGNQIGVTQGRLVGRKRYDGVPLILVKLLGAEGASGSPFVDDDGNVIGLLQSGFADGPDAFGQFTSGAIMGLDLNSWWGNGKRYLCRSYPNGGIPMCADSPTRPKPAPKPKPPPTPTCLDKAFLTHVGPDWKAATDAWREWERVSQSGTGDSYATIQEAFEALDTAASSAGVYTREEICSQALKRAVTLIEDVPAVTSDARKHLDAFLATQRGTPEYDTALQVGATALTSLKQRIDDIDRAFASR